MNSRQDPIVPRKYLAMGETVARRAPEVLAGRGLKPAFSDWLLTHHSGHFWLFGVLDVAKLGRLEHYTSPDTVHHLSTSLHGLPVYLSNQSGLRYAFLLSGRPHLPRQVGFPGFQPGLVQIGVDGSSRPVALPWNELGHVLVAGITGSGKSTLLRSIVYQALGEGTRLLLADLDGRSVPMLEEHPALLAPLARTPEEAAGVVARALGECDHREALYRQTPGFPDDLGEYNMAVAGVGRESLPRLLVVLDEFNAAVAASGGPRGPLASGAAQLAWRGRKFGVNLVLAAQDFSKEVIGRVRDQMQTAVCFRVRSPETARAVGCCGAQRIPESRPGRAITDRWGLVQTFHLDKSLLIDAQPRSALSEQERVLAEWALAKHEGRMSIPLLVGKGMSEREARNLVERWQGRGWVEKDPRRDNARYIMPKLADLLSNHQAGPAASNRDV